MTRGSFTAISSPKTSSDERVKVLDFGPAKLTGPGDVDGSSDREKEHVAGTVTGTAGYMSTEQPDQLPSVATVDDASFPAGPSQPLLENERSLTQTGDVRRRKFAYC
jgi:serine/threonine protein kinase